MLNAKYQVDIEKTIETEIKNSQVVSFQINLEPVLNLINIIY